MILILYHSNTKKCFKCGIEKKLFEFYKHKEMKDGYLNKCKSCTKKDTKNNYNKNIYNYKHRKKMNKNMVQFLKRSNSPSVLAQLFQTIKK